MYYSRVFHSIPHCKLNFDLDLMEPQAVSYGEGRLSALDAEQRVPIVNFHNFTLIVDDDSCRYSSIALQGGSLRNGYLWLNNTIDIPLECHGKDVTFAVITDVEGSISNITVDGFLNFTSSGAVPRSITASRFAGSILSTAAGAISGVSSNLQVHSDINGVSVSLQDCLDTVQPYSLDTFTALDTSFYVDVLLQPYDAYVRLPTEKFTGQDLGYDYK